jgi:tungstate transport system ATP-binding protein
LDGIGITRKGEALLADLCARIDAGQPTLVLGPNGAGKSLLLRVCHGLLKPDRGEIRWRGPRAGEAPLHQAMVLQRPVMLRRSAIDNIDYALRIRKTPRAKREAKVEEVLRATGLWELARRNAWDLSVGEQQRLALARAWSLEPEVLFLDEPTASIDPGAAHRLLRSIESIALRGTKIVMSTHDLRLAERLAGDVLFLHRGRLVESASGAAFFAGPATREASAFLSGELSW